MLELKRFLKRGETALIIGALVILMAAFTSCKKQSQGDSTTPSQDGQPNQASAFNGEVYRSQDGRVVVTMTSSDELELAKNGVNLICKYTRQANAIRAVETVMGTSQAVYYQIIPEGIRDPEGRILYLPSALQKVNEQAELASRQAAEQARMQAEEQANEQRRLEARLQESHTPKTVVFASSEPAVLNIFPSQIFFVSKTTVTDVSITFAGTERIRDARFEGTEGARRVADPFELSYWFGEALNPTLQITYRYNLPNGPLFQIDVPDRRPGQASMHGNIDFYFQKPGVLEPFVETVKNAHRSWRAKYEDVASRR